ncbi:type IV pilus assembly protein PilM [Candidatus Sumerlaeota bacterium]|nr:type IV pilus assembly protein PilM [Candidatus Sumerlaeota bacterium]
MFKRKAAFGLDIGSCSVKAVQMRRTSRGIELEKFASVPIYPNGKSDSETDVRAAKIAAIERAVAAAKITAKNVVSSVSGESIIVRYIQLPHMTEEELRNALRYEAEEYIPFHIEEVNLDSHILGVTEEGGSRRLNVLLVAAKKDIIGSHLDLIRGAGLIPEIVDVDSFALFNCYEQSARPSPDEVVVLVDIGSQITNINIYHGGLSHFARDINLGGRTITTALEQKLGISFSEAEQLKFSEGVHVAAPAPSVDTDGGEGEDSPLIESLQGAVNEMTGEDLGDDSLESQASRIIRGSLNTLVAEIRRSLQFFENQVSGQPVSRMVLCGGTARLPNIANHFTQEIGLPTEIFNPVASLSLNSKNIDENTLANCREVLGVGIGLALRKVA